MKKEINERLKSDFFFFALKHKIAMVTAMIIQHQIYLLFMEDIELTDFASNLFRRKPIHNFKGKSFHKEWIAK